MSFPIVEQFAHLRAGNVFTAFSLAQQAIRSLEELVELNFEFAKQSLPDSRSATELLLSDKTPIELWVEQANRIRPVTEKVLAHQRHAFDIAMRNHAALLDIIDAQYQQQQTRLRDAVEGLEKNAPAASQAAVTALKSAVSIGDVGFETIRKAAAQVIAMAQKGEFGNHSFDQAS